MINLIASIKNIFKAIASLGFRFLLLFSIITILSLGSIYQVNQTSKITERITHLRVPASHDILSIINGINGALATLRGWMLIGNEEFKEERKKIWQQHIYRPLNNILKLSLHEKQDGEAVHLGHEEDIAQLKHIKKLIPELEKVQKNIEEMANSPENIPALLLLSQKATPLADRMSQQIDLIIEQENDLPATPARKRLLGIMADANSSLGMAIVKMREFLISGDKEIKSEFQFYWEKNQQAFDALANKQYLLTSEQKKIYQNLFNTRIEFMVFPKQLMTMRESSDWNLSTYWLKTKAAPLGNEIISILNRMLINQKQYLHQGMEKIAEKNQLFKILLWTNFIFGIGLAIFLTRYISKEKHSQKIINEEKEHLKALSECSGLKDTCDTALQRLANDYGAVTGQLYYFNKSTDLLHLAGLYGSNIKDIASTINIGDGILGQTFINNTLSRIDYDQVGTPLKLGELSVIPELLLTFPLSYNQMPIAVAQFSCLKRLNPQQEANLTRKLQTTARFIYDAIQTEETNRQLKLLDKEVILSSTDLDGVITHVSSAFAKISDYKKEQMIGEKHSLVRHPDMDNAVFKDLWDTISSGKSWRGEIKNIRQDGDYYWVDASISPVYDLYNNITGYTAVRSNITDKKKVEELSITDGLTGLFNRRHFDTLFEKLLKKSREEQKILAFGIMDIDYFKPYNDNYGHQLGDKTLQQVAGALKEFSKQANEYVFRLGGEEFGILFYTDNIDNAESVAKRINSAISNLKIPHDFSQADPHVSISIGLLSIPFNADLDVTSLYKKADEQLYQAKETGRNKAVCLDVGK